jgi:hypothetical protein
MPEYRLKTAGRQFRRQFKTAIRSNLVRAITELITNADDTYRRLEDKDIHPSGIIRVEYDRKDRIISVIDDGEGMDADDMKEAYTTYGASTSGLHKNIGVRGYFGKGLKDVLFSMEKGRVKSIKDKCLYTAKFKWSGDTPKIDISDRTQRVSRQMRKAFGIKSNGTRVEFEIPRDLPLPRHDSLLRGLSNFYMLRLINSNESREPILITKNVSGESLTDNISYVYPQGELALRKDFNIIHDGLGQFQIKLEVYRASSPLTQTGEDREGGLVVIDDEDAVLDLTLFRFDYDENASNLFGKLKVLGFRRLLLDEETVLTDTRDGLDKNHDFYKNLCQEIESHLEPIVDEERRRRQKERGSKISRKHQRRLDNSIRRLNELLRKLTDQAWAHGGDIGRLDIKAESGLEFWPHNVNVLQNVETKARLWVNTSIIQPGKEITLTSDKNTIIVKPERINAVASPDEELVAHTVSITGRVSGDEGMMRAVCEGRVATISVMVIPVEYPIPREGLEFIPGNIGVSDNQRQSAHLFVSSNVGQPGDIIKVRTTCQDIQLISRSIEIKNQMFRGDVAKALVPFRASGIGTSGEIIASVNSQETTLSISVISKRTRRHGKSGLLTGYRFDNEILNRRRASYDEQTGEIVIYLKNPIMARYFGGVTIDTALSISHCQILLAEVILEEFAWVARRKMIESGAELYLGDNHVEEDLAGVERLIYEYGCLIHEWLLPNSSLDEVFGRITEASSANSRNSKSP